MSTKVDIDTAPLLAVIKQYKAAVLAGTMRGARNIALTMKREAKKDAPKKTGTLRRAIDARITKGAQKTLIEVGIGTPVGGEPLVYARVQDLGGIIRPKSAKKLAWPLKNSFTKKHGIYTKAGVSGVRARNVINNPAQFGIKQAKTSGKPYIFFTERAIMGVPEDAKRVPIPGSKAVRKKKGRRAKKRPWRYKAVGLFARADQVYVYGNRYLADQIAEMGEGGKAVAMLHEAVNASVGQKLQGK